MNFKKKIVENIEKLKNDLSTTIIFALGIVARLIAFILAKPIVFQHDVLAESGHMDYAMYIFNNWHLADNNYYEFAQPPINATLQAVFMKILSPFFNLVSEEELAVGDYVFNAEQIKIYTCTKLLTLVYSIITLIIIYKIIKEFDLSKIAKNVFFGIMALYPGLIVMTTQYSNDCISYMFFYLSLYLGIKWCKNKDLKTIVLLALSIGVGMLTKVSVGLIAFILGPMMLIIWLRSLKGAKADSLGKSADTAEASVIRSSVGASIASPSITKQLIIFALIVFPIGLSYSIRNYIVFGQKFGEISNVVSGTVFDMTERNFTFVERYLSFQLYKLFDGRYDIFHDWTEYNIWVDLVKTSAFDEFQFRFDNIYPALFVVYLLNIVFWFLGIVSVIYNSIVIKIKKIKLPENLKNLKNLSLMLFALAIIAFFSFNVNYPYSCNSNYRYVAYITFALAGNIIIMALTIFSKDIGKSVERVGVKGGKAGAKSNGVGGTHRKPVVVMSSTSVLGTDVESIRNTQVYLILLAFVAINLLLFSSVSPLHSIMNMQYNEWLYYIIGKGIKYGKVPYVDLIDHKGIYLFFIYAIANMIEVNHIGLYIVAVAFYYLVALYSYKISYLLLSAIRFNGNTIISFISAFIVFVISSSYYLSFGTITCELFILALSLIAYYIYLKSVLNVGASSTSPRDALIYGILAGISFFIKANGILLFASIAISLLITYIKNKNYTDLIRNVLFGLLGFIVSLLPGIVYCLINNCFMEMIDGSFIVNMLYTGTGLPSLNSLSASFIETIYEFKEFVVMCFASMFMFAYLVRNVDKKTKHELMTFYIIPLIINTYSVFMSVRPYTNYLNYLLFYILIAVVFLIVIIVKVFVSHEINTVDKSLQASKKILLISVVVIVLLNVLSYSLTYELSSQNGYSQSKVAKQITKIYKSEENAKRKPKLLVVGYAPYLYEEFQVLPNEKYFATPVVPRKKYPEPYNALIKRIDRASEDLIIVAFERSMLKDEEFKEMVYNALATNYEKIGDSNAVGIKTEIFRKKVANE